MGYGASLQRTAGSGQSSKFRFRNSNFEIKDWLLEPLRFERLERFQRLERFEQRRIPACIVDIFAFKWGAVFMRVFT